MTEKEEKELSKNNLQTDKKIEDMFNNIKNDGLKVTETKEAISRKKKKKIIIIALIGALTLVPVVTYYLSKQSNVDVNNGNTMITNENNNSNNNETEKKDNIVQIVLPDWLRTSYYNSLTGEYYNKLITSLDDKNFYYMTEVFPSTADGFTNDVGQMYDEDGLPNIYFTTATKEDIKFNTIQYINRLINPIFGEWTKYQYGKINDPAEMSPEIYDNMFTQNYISKNSKKMPFLADFDKNDFGYQWSNEYTNNPRFIGVIKDIDNFVTNEEMNQIDIEASIEVHGNPNSGKITKNYKLKMKLIIDVENNNKLLIDEIEMKEEK